MMKIANIPEREIRRFIQGYTDMDRQYEFLLDVVNKYYNGRFTDLIFSLIDGESEDFRRVDESLLLLDDVDHDRVRFMLELKRSLDLGTTNKKTCVYIIRDLQDCFVDLSYLSEFDKLLEAYCNEVKEIDIYCILRRVLDIFVFDFIDETGIVDLDVRRREIFIYLIKNNDNLELVLY